jgi:hypothetical protein
LTGRNLRVLIPADAPPPAGPRPQSSRFRAAHSPRNPKPPATPGTGGGPLPACRRRRRPLASRTPDRGSGSRASAPPAPLHGARRHTPGRQDRARRTAQGGGRQHFRSAAGRPRAQGEEIFFIISSLQLVDTFEFLMN